MSDVRFEGTSEIQELQVLGDWAYLRNYIETEMAAPNGGTPAHMTGYTLTILCKRWRLARDANLVSANPESGEKR